MVSGKRMETETSPARRALLDEGTGRLRAAGVGNARREAEWLLAETLSCSRAMLYARPARRVPMERAETFRAWIERRAGGEPLQYVLGHADFFDLRLKVTPSVLIPRPETEEVVEEALARVRTVETPTVLDAGTGSGCIALAVKHARPGAEVHACDVRPEALALARENARAHRLDVRFLEADLLAEAAAALLPHGLDLLVSNPPYIPDDEAEALPASVRDHEPPPALFCGDDPLRFYRVLARLSGELLRGGGHLVLEAHARYTDGVAALLRTQPFLADVAVKPDRTGRPRVAVAERVEN